jgi:hypothetical protein
MAGSLGNYGLAGAILKGGRHLSHGIGQRFDAITNLHALALQNHFDSQRDQQKHERNLLEIESKNKARQATLNTLQKTYGKQGFDYSHDGFSLKVNPLTPAKKTK